MTPPPLRAVVYPAEGVWIAQGVDVHICAFSDQIADLPRKFVRAVSDHVLISEHLGRLPFKGLGAVPERFIEMYEEAGATLALVKPERFSEIGAVELRVAAVPA